MTEALFETRMRWDPPARRPFFRGKVRTLVAQGMPAVYFHRETPIEHGRAGNAYFYALPELYLSERGEDQHSALARIVRTLRREAERLRTAPTHTLAADEQEQKQRLLGTVDLVASRLLGDVPATTWILGEVVVGEDGKMKVREVGSDARTFDLDPSLQVPSVPDTSARLVCVQAGPAGEAVGPVIKMEEPLGQNPSQTWAEWRRRLEEGEKPQ